MIHDLLPGVTQPPWLVVLAISMVLILPPWLISSDPGDITEHGVAKNTELSGTRSRTKRAIAQPPSARAVGVNNHGAQVTQKHSKISHEL